MARILMTTHTGVMRSNCSKGTWQNTGNMVNIRSNRHGWLYKGMQQRFIYCNNIVFDSVYSKSGLYTPSFVSWWWRLLVIRSLLTHLPWRFKITIASMDKTQDIFNTRPPHALLYAPVTIQIKINRIHQYDCNEKKTSEDRSRFNSRNIMYNGYTERTEDLQHNTGKKVVLIGTQNYSFF